MVLTRRQTGSEPPSKSWAPLRDQENRLSLGPDRRNGAHCEKRYNKDLRGDRLECRDTAIDLSSELTISSRIWVRDEPQLRSIFEKPWRLS